MCVYIENKKIRYLKPPKQHGSINEEDRTKNRFVFFFFLLLYLLDFFFVPRCRRKKKRVDATGSASIIVTQTSSLSRNIREKVQSWKDKRVFSRSTSKKI